jgi:ADP-heptose:LPS heptosyltransferase
MAVILHTLKHQQFLFVQKILIIQTAFIGDVVLATVIAERIHAAFPNSQIDFLLRKGNEGLLKNHPFIHETLIWDKKQQKLKNLFKLIAQIRKTKYDRVINVQRFFATGLITTFSGATEKVGFDKNPLSSFFNKTVKHVIATNAAEYIHETDRNLLLVNHFTPPVPPKMRLYPSLADEEAVAGYKSCRYICIAPSSVWFTKQYPVDKWVAFLQKVPSDIKVYLIGGGSADNIICEKIKTDSGGTNVENLCNKLSFLASASLMKDALMNYVNDSAPLHFASAMDAPVTAVFCSTIPLFGYGPLSSNSAIVQIEQPLACRPCGLHGKKACPEGHFKCAYNIKEEQLERTLLSAAL